MLIPRMVTRALYRATASPTIKRSLTSSFICRTTPPYPSREANSSNLGAGETQASSGGNVIGANSKKLKKFEEIRSMEDLLPPGAEPGTIPSDLDQAVGLERLEILGKMQGIDIFDMKPLDASRLGTLDNPIMVKSAGEENYAGCTGFPADSHNVIWLTVSRSRPIERCPECGNVVKMEYIGPEDDPHSHGHHDHPAYEEPKTFADYIRPEYRYR